MDEVRRLKTLETENARLKKPVAERDLEIEVMKEIDCALSACFILRVDAWQCYSIAGDWIGLR